MEDNNNNNNNTSYSSSYTSSNFNVSNMNYLHIEQEPEMKLYIHKLPSSSVSTKAQTAVQSPRNNNNNNNNTNLLRKSSNLPVQILNSPSAKSIHNTEVTYILPDSDYEDSFYTNEYNDNYTNNNNNTTTNGTVYGYGNQIIYSNKSTIYEREMLKLYRKEEILKSKRIQAYQNEINKLQDVPCVNGNYNYKKKRNSSMINLSIKDNNNNDLPIYQRAGDLHSRRLYKIKINEELKHKNKKENEDAIISLTKRNTKKFNEHTWNKFIDNQFNWKEQLTYKNKINQLLKQFNVNSKIKSKKYI